MLYYMFRFRLLVGVRESLNTVENVLEAWKGRSVVTLTTERIDKQQAPTFRSQHIMCRHE